MVMVLCTRMRVHAVTRNQWLEGSGKREPKTQTNHGLEKQHVAIGSLVIIWFLDNKHDLKTTKLFHSLWCLEVIRHCQKPYYML